LFELTICVHEMRSSC